MDIQQLNDQQLAWLRRYFQERREFFVVKDSSVPNQHFCQIKAEVSYCFTCRFYCNHRVKCGKAKRQANFESARCRLYEGPHDDR